MLVNCLPFFCIGTKNNQLYARGLFCIDKKDAPH